MPPAKRKPKEAPLEKSAPPRNKAGSDFPSWFIPLALIGLVVAAVLIVHWPALSARAILFDDQEYLLSNPLVQHPSWTSAGRFLSEILAPSTVHGYYQPMTMISLMLDCAIGGSPSNIEPFHRTSLVFHAVNTALIVILLYRLFGHIWAAALVGLLFGVHPMTVEPIAWVGERKTLLASFFALTAMLSYVRYTRTGRRSGYALALALFVLALMSKPTTTPLPLLLLLLDAWPLRRLSIRTAIEKIPFAAIAGLSAAITYWSQKQTSIIYNLNENSPLRIPLTLCHNIVYYPLKMLWPVNLSSHQPFPQPMNLSQPMVLAGVVGTGLLLVVLAVSLRRTRALATGWLFFFAAILPTMGIIGFTNVIASDKYAYLPAVGFLLVATWLLAQLWGPSLPAREMTPRRLAIVLVTLSLAGLEATATRHYLHLWRDSVTLYQHMLKLTPNEAVLHNNFGNALQNLDQVHEAFEHFSLAIRLNPNNVEAHINITNALFRLKRYDEAIEYGQKAIRLKPDSPLAHSNLATALAARGRIDDAIPHWTESLRLNSNAGEACYNLAHALGSQGKLDDAIARYRQAIGIRPDYAQAHNNLANTLAATNQLDEAVPHWLEAIRLNPRYAEPHGNLGFALLERERWDESADHFRQALAIDPNLPGAREGLAKAMTRQKPNP